MVENPTSQKEAVQVVSFLYGGFGLRKSLGGSYLDEHGLLRNQRPRFEGHVTYKYSLPDVDSRGLVDDVKYTTEKGWDDNDKEVLSRYVKIAEYAGINALAFTLYGGVENDGTKNIFMEKPLINFLDSHEDFPGMSFAPMICAALPRLSLPITVPVEDSDEYRFEFIRKENLEFLVKHALERYFAPNPDKHFSISNRPVMFLFDYVRIAIEKRFGFDTNILNRTIDHLREFAWDEYGVDPFFIAIINNPAQAEKVNACHVDMISNYIDLPYFHKAPEWPIQPYQKITSMRKNEWVAMDEKATHPFIPALVSGFDATSRVAYKGRGKIISPGNYTSGNWYPLIPVVPNEKNRPTQFKEYIESGLEYTKRKGLPFINFGPLNELTEQCSLLPNYTRYPEETSGEILNTVKNTLSSRFGNREY